MFKEVKDGCNDKIDSIPIPVQCKNNVNLVLLRLLLKPF